MNANSEVCQRCPVKQMSACKQIVELGGSECLKQLTNVLEEEQINSGQKVTPAPTPITGGILKARQLIENIANIRNRRNHHNGNNHRR